MLRSGDDHPLGGPMPPPIMEHPCEVDWPENAVLCVLFPRGASVEWLVNVAHGALGYEHGGYHAERGLAGMHACVLGRDCGYDPAARHDPECAPSRQAPLGPPGRHDGRG
jgi:hypothetical protein